MLAKPKETEERRGEEQGNAEEKQQESDKKARKMMSETFGIPPIYPSNLYFFPSLCCICSLLALGENPRSTSPSCAMAKLV